MLHGLYNTPFYVNRAPLCLPSATLGAFLPVTTPEDSYYSALVSACAPYFTFHFIQKEEMLWYL